MLDTLLDISCSLGVGEFDQVDCAVEGTEEAAAFAGFGIPFLEK